MITHAARLHAACLVDVRVVTAHGVSRVTTADVVRFVRLE